MTVFSGELISNTILDTEWTNHIYDEQYNLAYSDNLKFYKSRRGIGERKRAREKGKESF